MSFQDLGLDPRLLRALNKRGFTKPTPVQLECIPKTLEGKDIVARARTGSGKTLAYLLPIFHKILSTEVGKAGWRAIILVPTRELCEQVKLEAQALAQHCGVEITATALTGEAPNAAAQRAAVAAAGHIVVATPGRIARALREGALTAALLSSRLQALVLDEADLLLSYGYEEDLQVLAPQVPRACQCLLMSATASEELARLQALVLHNPLTLNCLEASGADGGLAAGAGTAAEIDHYALASPDKADKLLLVLALLKLNLVRKKVLIFVNSVDEAFRLRLFLESFGIRPALLNAELPLNSRSHILATFNRGLFDYLIATDDVHAVAHDGGQPGKKQTPKPVSSKPGKSGSKKDEEFGVTRGIDFKGVNTIVNYDLPSSVQGYVHRVGRTGRAGQSGSAITLFTPEDELFKCELASALADSALAAGQQASVSGRGADSDDEVGSGEEGFTALSKQVLKPYARLTKAAVEGLRYRGEDVARSITKAAVKEARAKDLKLELLNSDRLKEYFEDHEAEAKLLRHDKPLHAVAPAPHLKHVPAYLRDPSLQTNKSSVGSGSGALPARKRRRTEGADPLKAGGFLRAPKRATDELTELEKKAIEKPIKAPKKPGFLPKGNVKKNNGKGATRRR